VQYIVWEDFRDLFLRLPNFDVDLVVEGDGIVLPSNWLKGWEKG
jgi:hypothetical protein